MREVRVNRKAGDRVLSGHPWIFSSDVVDRGGAEPGSAVRVLDHRGRLLGTAHYSSSSQITLRMLSNRAEPIDRAFFLRKLHAAARFRERAVANTDAYRVVYGEADLLPALIVDRYGDFAVLQTLDQGMDAATETIVECVREALSPKAIVARNDVAVRTREELPVEKRVLWGEAPGETGIRMNGLAFTVDVMGGQKTGIFLDQRENYLAAARYIHGTALDCFTSTGGFALHLAASCERIEAVDSSATALATAARNREANGIANIEFREADAFDVLASHASARRRFDAVVLDPPAFSKSRSSLQGAARGYKEINLRALRLLEAGGVLVTCSCSHHMSEAMLLEVLAQAALDTGRTVRVLERRTQAQDHPILLTVPETHYLKCLILQVV